MSVTDEAVTHTRPDGVQETVRWEELGEVSIVTTDQGPFQKDVFFVLISSDGKSGCAVPQSSAGQDRLLERLHELPGCKAGREVTRRVTKMRATHGVTRTRVTRGVTKIGVTRRVRGNDDRSRALFRLRNGNDDPHAHSGAERSAHRRQQRPYLLYLGIRQWRAPPADLAGTAPLPKRRAFARGFLVSLTNPKTLLFYGAFFPQFITAGDGMAAQIMVLSGSFLALGLLLDGGWAILAGRARGVLAAGRWRNRLSGGLLIGAGIGLALARRR